MTDVPTPQPDAVPDAKYDTMTGKRLDKPSRKPLYILIAVLAVLALGAVAANRAGDDKQEMKGLLQLISAGDVEGDLENCEGTGGYDDIQEGADVTIKDQDGKTVGTGRLENGTTDQVVDRMVESGDDAKRSELEEILDDTEGIACVLLWDANVAKADIYSIQIGNEARGELTYSKDDLDESDWVVEVTLGT